MKTKEEIGSVNGITCECEKHSSKYDELPLRDNKKNKLVQTGTIVRYKCDKCGGIWYPIGMYCR